MLEELLPDLLNFGYTLLEACASEHSAFMLAMKNATEKSLELAEINRRSYNKQRQALITKEISEIVSGIEAMK